MNDYLPNATSNHINCSCNHCFHLLVATGTCFVIGFEFTKHLYNRLIRLFNLFDWYIKVHEGEGDEEEEEDEGAAPVPLTFHQAAEHLTGVEITPKSR